MSDMSGPWVKPLTSNGYQLSTSPQRLGRMHLSTDIRYQNVREEIDARWQEHWSLDDML